jgi:hypothetical protein
MNKWMTRVARHATEFGVDAGVERVQYNEIYAEYLFRTSPTVHNSRNVETDIAMALLQEIKRLRKKLGK